MLAMTSEVMDARAPTRQGSVRRSCRRATTEIPMHDPNAVAAAYLATWNEADPTRRSDLLRTAWSEDADYTDPMMKGCGHDGIAAMIAGARDRFPGHSFRLHGTPDGHGDVVRFSWTLVSPEAAPVAGGTDVVRLDPDGRIASVTGFLDAA